MKLLELNLAGLKGQVKEEEYMRYRDFITANFEYGSYKGQQDRECSICCEVFQYSSYHCTCLVPICDLCLCEWAKQQASN